MFKLPKQHKHGFSEKTCLKCQNWGICNYPERCYCEPYKVTDLIKLKNEEDNIAILTNGTDYWLEMFNQKIGYNIKTKNYKSRSLKRIIKRHKINKPILYFPL